MASQITSLTIVYSSVYSDANHRKHQSSASLAFVLGIHRWPVNSLHKKPVTRKMFSFDDAIMRSLSSLDSFLTICAIAMLRTDFARDGLQLYHTSVSTGHILWDALDYKYRLNQFCFIALLLTCYIWQLLWPNFFGSSYCQTSRVKNV